VGVARWPGPSLARRDIEEQVDGRPAEYNNYVQRRTNVNKDLTMVKPSLARLSNLGTRLLIYSSIALTLSDMRPMNALIVEIMS
jgi:hypothetical protein